MEVELEDKEKDYAGVLLDKQKNNRNKHHIRISYRIRNKFSVKCVIGTVRGHDNLKYKK